MAIFGHDDKEFTALTKMHRDRSMPMPIIMAIASHAYEIDPGELCTLAEQFVGLAWIPTQPKLLTRDHGTGKLI